VKNLVGRENAIWLTSKYDMKVVIPFLMVCFEWLNPIVNACIIVVVDVVRLDLKENMFGAGASIKEIS